MIKSNWPIKNLIMLLDLNFMQICPIIIYFDLEFAFFSPILGTMGRRKALNFLRKLQIDFLPILPIFLDQLSPHCQLLFYFFLYFFLFLFKKSEFLGITQNWVMTIYIGVNYILGLVSPPANLRKSIHAGRSMKQLHGEDFMYISI
jgi:hypothetical protein